MIDKEYLESQRKALADSVEFFRSDRKPERERWVVREFLTNLGGSFNEDELLSSPQDPPDVLFRNAKFEIKEILSEGRRRHQEYKEGFEKGMSATTPADFIEMFTPKDIPISEVCSLILKEATNLAKEKYSPATCKSIDLLFYVNLTDVFGLVETPFPNLHSFEILGYQSISFIMGYRSCTLAAADEAPSFLKTVVGRIVHRKRV